MTHQSNDRQINNAVQIRLDPGDEFRIGQDGRTVVTRNNGNTEALFPSEGQSIIRITV
jgi:hypothetical protein